MMEGMTETLSAVQKLGAELERPAANAELRAAAGQCASGLAGALVSAAASSGVPVAPRVARSVTVKKDRLPAVSIGGPMMVGSGKRGQAAALVWGSEQGPKSDPNRFAVAPNPSGYWIAPTAKRFGDGPALDAYGRAVHNVLERFGLA